MCNRHSEIYPKGCETSQTSGYERRPDFFKSWQRSDQRRFHSERRNQATLKPTVGAVLEATVNQVASKLSEMRNNYNDAPPPNPPIVLQEFNHAGSGKKRRRRLVYKSHKRSKYLSNQWQIIYNC